MVFLFQYEPSEEAYMHVAVGPAAQAFGSALCAARALYIHHVLNVADGVLAYPLSGAAQWSVGGSLRTHPIGRALEGRLTILAQMAGRSFTEVAADVERGRVALWKHEVDCRLAWQTYCMAGHTEHGATATRLLLSLYVTEAAERGILPLDAAGHVNHHHAECPVYGDAVLS